MRRLLITKRAGIIAIGGVALACSVAYARACWKKTGIGCCLISEPAPTLVKWTCPKPAVESCIDQLIDNPMVSHAVLGTPGNEGRVASDPETCKFDSYNCNSLGYCVVFVAGRITQCTPTDPDGTTPPCSG